MEHLSRIHDVHFNGRIIFMSMSDDIVWEENDNTEECNQNANEVSKYARRFPCGRWSFLGPGLEKTWYKTCSHKPNRDWDRTAGMMILQLTTESDYQWKEKGQCSQGDRCSSRHEAQDRAQKPEHTAATLSEPTLSRRRSVSRKRSIRGRSNHMVHSSTTVQILFERYLHVNVL